MNRRIEEKTRAASPRTREKLEREILAADQKMEALLDHERSLDSLDCLMKKLLAKLGMATEIISTLVAELPTKETVGAAARNFAKFAIAGLGDGGVLHMIRSQPERLVSQYVLAEHRTEILTQFDAELTDELFERLQESLSKRADDLKEIGLFVAAQDAVAAEKKRRAERKY